MTWPALPGCLSVVGMIVIPSSMWLGFHWAGDFLGTQFTRRLDTCILVGTFSCSDIVMHCSTGNSNPYLSDLQINKTVIMGPPHLYYVIKSVHYIGMSHLYPLFPFCPFEQKLEIQDCRTWPVQYYSNHIFTISIKSLRLQAYIRMFDKGFKIKFYC